MFSSSSILHPPKSRSSRRELAVGISEQDEHTRTTIDEDDCAEENVLVPPEEDTIEFAHPHEGHEVEWKDVKRKQMLLALRTRRELDDLVLEKQFPDTTIRTNSSSSTKRRSAAGRLSHMLGHAERVAEETAHCDMYGIALGRALHMAVLFGEVIFTQLALERLQTSLHNPTIPIPRYCEWYQDHAGLFFLVLGTLSNVATIFHIVVYLTSATFAVPSVGFLQTSQNPRENWELIFEFAFAMNGLLYVVLNVGLLTVIVLGEWPLFVLSMVFLWTWRLLVTTQRRKNFVSGYTYWNNRWWKESQLDLKFENGFILDNIRKIIDVFVGSDGGFFTFLRVVSVLVLDLYITLFIADADDSGSLLLLTIAAGMEAAELILVHALLLREGRSQLDDDGTVRLTRAAVYVDYAVAVATRWEVHYCLVVYECDVEGIKRAMIRHATMLQACGQVPGDWGRFIEWPISALASEGSTAPTSVATFKEEERGEEEWKVKVIVPPWKLKILVPRMHKLDNATQKVVRHLCLDYKDCEVHTYAFPS